MGLIIALYFVFLIVFIILSILVVRHLLKFGYLAPQFKTVVIGFSIISIIVIIFSFIVLFQIGSEPSSSPSNTYEKIDTSSSGSSSGLNF